MNGRTNTTSVTEVIEGVQIPLEPVTSFALAPDTGKIALTWTDPVDKVATPGGEMVAEWNYTLIIRREDRAPVSPSDGIQVLREGTRNQYSSTPYMDEGLNVGKTYYYAAYAYSTIGVVSEAATGSASPREAILKYYQTKNFGQSDFGSDQWNQGNEAYATSMTDSSDVTFVSTQNNVLVAFPLLAKSRLYSFDKSFTKSQLSDFPTQKYLASSESVNGNGFIVGGSMSDPSDGGLFYKISPELTVQSGTYSGLNKYFMASATVGNSVVFASGRNHVSYATAQYLVNTVHAINESMTVTPLANTVNRSDSMAGTTNGRHAIFAGGDPFVAGGYDPVAYDSSFTQTKLSSISSTVYAVAWMKGVYLNTRALFAGGQREANVDANISSVVLSYNQSLTIEKLTDLSTPKVKLGAENIGGFALFAGGNTDLSGKDYHSRTVDVYNSSFTRSSGPTLPNTYDNYINDYTGRTFRMSGKIDNVAMFFALPMPEFYDDWSNPNNVWTGIASYIVE